MNQKNGIKVCHCGRAIPHRGNSTIQAKMCPNCAYKYALRSSRKRKLDNNGDKVDKLTTQGIKSEIKPRNTKNGVNWMKVADRWFSRWTRLRFSMVQKDGETYACDIITNKFYSCKNLDCGHYFSRYWPGTRYYENNCWPQNRSSNRFRGEADKDKFRENIIKRIGQDEFDLIERRKYDPLPGTYREIAERYRRKVNELVKKRGISKWW